MLSWAGWRRLGPLQGRTLRPMACDSSTSRLRLHHRLSMIKSTTTMLTAANGPTVKVGEGGGPALFGSGGSFWLSSPVVAKKVGLQEASTHASQAGEAPAMHRLQQDLAVHEAMVP